MPGGPFDLTVTILVLLLCYGKSSETAVSAQVPPRGKRLGTMRCKKAPLGAQNLR